MHLLINVYGLRNMSQIRVLSRNEFFGGEDGKGEVYPR